MSSNVASPMTTLILLAQAAQQTHGWLTTRLLEVTLTSAEWVIWLLVGLSVISIALMLERLVYFSSHRLPGAHLLAARLSRGELEEIKREIGERPGMEAAVLREGIAAISQGPDTVERVIAATIARERPQYERSLSFLGTLGNNAPFIGLFGTVLGIIKAFHDLGQTTIRGSAIQQTVMTGISEALVATAVGLGVAIPAVVGFNGFTRWLKTMTARTEELGHALVGHLRADQRSEVAVRPSESPVREVR
jgi:biopolymer transport protein ExbB